MAGIINSITIIIVILSIPINFIISALAIIGIIVVSAKTS